MHHPIPGERRDIALSRLSRQFTAFFTSAAILSSLAAVRSFKA
jgi:hypothetical protein